MRTVAFTSAFALGTTLFALVLMLHDWSQHPFAAAPVVIALLWFGLYALGGPLARGFPGIGGKRTTLLLYAAAAAEGGAAATAIATRSTRDDVSSAALTVGLIAAALLWAGWNGYSWYLRLRGQTDTEKPRDPRTANT